MAAGATVLSDISKEAVVDLASEEGLINSFFHLCGQLLTKKAVVRGSGFCVAIFGCGG